MGARLNETIEDAIYDWAVGILAIPVIWDKQDVDPDAPHADLPALPFIKLNIISGPQSIGESDIRYKETDTYEQTFREKIVVSVQIFAGADDIYLEKLMKLKRSLKKKSILETLRVAGIAIWTITDPADISKFLETQHELRASMEITMSYSIVENDIPGEIQKLTYEKTNDPTFTKLVQP